MIIWTDELTKPSAVGLLASLRRRDPGLPEWTAAERVFADASAQTMQDRIMRSLLAAYRLPDLRAGPLIVALLWRRICARCNGDDDQVQTLVVAVLEMAPFADTDRSELAMRLVAAATDRIRLRHPGIRTTPLSNLIPSPEPSMPPPPEHYLTAKEAAKVLKLKDHRTLTSWAKAGRITPSRLPNGHYRYTQQEIDRVLAGRKA
jgi:hypothetical protein